MISRRLRRAQTPVNHLGFTCETLSLGNQEADYLSTFDRQGASFRRHWIFWALHVRGRRATLTDTGLAV
jgi:hypothetical protein